MDRVSKEKRSQIMSKIKGKNTTPEQIVFRALKENGMRFKKHYRLLGSPDIAFVKEKVAIFIDGDFWHGYDFASRRNKLPEYWVNKITRNIERDSKFRKSLKAEGWKVLRLWEHEVIRYPKKSFKKIIRIIENVRATDSKK